MKRNKMLLCAFLLFAAFVMRAGGQTALSAKEKARFEQSIRETPFVDIAVAIEEAERLHVVSRAPDVPQRKAFSLVSYTSPTFSFASIPTYVHVSQIGGKGEYRASGKTQFQGQAAVWSLTIRSSQTAAPMPSSAPASSCEFYLSVLSWRTRRIVYERGKAHKLMEAPTCQIPIIQPPIITQEPLK